MYSQANNLNTKLVGLKLPDCNTDHIRIISTIIFLGTELKIKKGGGDKQRIKIFSLESFRLTLVPIINKFYFRALKDQSARSRYLSITPIVNHLDNPRAFFPLSYLP